MAGSAGTVTPARAVGEMALAVKEFRTKLQLLDVEDGRSNGRAPLG